MNIFYASVATRNKLWEVFHFIAIAFGEESL